MAWSTIVDHLEASQHLLPSPSKQLTSLDIISLILRKENYLVAMVNKGILSTNFPGWIPGVGPAWGGERGKMRGRKGEVREKKSILLTKVVEWALDWCIFRRILKR